jgi:hypothetical protein
MTLDTIRSDFAFLDDWEDRYRYVIELGRGLPRDEAVSRKPKGHDFVIARRTKKPAVARHMSVTG